jgi:hypothetical protein
VNVVIRTVVTLISALAALYFVFWVGGALIYGLNLSSQITFLGSWLIAAVAAFIVARYVWRHTASIEPGLGSSMLLGAITIGGIGFSLGFFGPLLFAPGANQGPLLGIFITGPVGLLLGAVGGAVYWSVRRSRGGGPIP